MFGEDSDDAEVNFVDRTWVSFPQRAVHTI